jgi:Domain of Unknown Function (DUF1206)
MLMQPDQGEPMVATIGRPADTAVFGCGDRREVAGGSDADMSTRTSVENPTARLVAEHPGLVRLGRAGWAAKGVVYAIAGVLAASVLIASLGWSSSSNQEASPTGAIKTIAGSPGGALLLWVLGLSMLLYAAWRVISALLPGSHDAEGAAKRVGYVVSAVIYTTFAITAITLARSGGGDTQQTNGNTKVTNLTARVMSYGIGRWLVGLIGLVVIAAGIYRLVKGAKQDVEDELDLSGCSRERITWTRRLGAIGEIGRGAAITVIGVFLLRAAVDFDPKQATGLDGALRRLALEWWGEVVVAVIALGFIAYGVFCLATFTRRRLEGP